MAERGRLPVLLSGATALFVLASSVSLAHTRPGRPTDAFTRSDAFQTQGAQVGGNKRAVLLCAFPDAPSPSTKQKPYFVDLYKDPQTGLLAYFDEASYGKLNVSATIYDWQTLPSSYNDYQDQSQKLFEECTDVHDPVVDFTKFDAIDIIANDRIGGAHLGGRQCWVAGTVSKCWPFTEIALDDGNDSNNAALWAHEIGHSFDLPHTSSVVGASHYWDPLSAPGLWCFVDGQLHPAYECFPTHYLAAHKDATKVTIPGFGEVTFGLGWIPKARRFIAKKGESKIVKLERLAEPNDNGNDLIARIPVPGERYFYAAEARIGKGRFDSDKNLPSDGVVITHVDWRCNASCPGYTPVRVIGKDANNDFRIDPQSALWKPGETYRNQADGVKVQVLSKIGEHAYRVKITVED